MLGKGASRNFYTILRAINELGFQEGRLDLDENILNIDDL